MARIVFSMSSSSVQPSRSAPEAITSREQPAAKEGDLNFFLRDLTSRSMTLPEGRIFTAAPMSPVSSSTANSAFSIGSSGSTSAPVMPQPWLTMARSIAGSISSGSSISRTATQCRSGNRSKSRSCKRPTTAQ